MRELFVEAANILDVGEFEVLRRAYQNWHGTEASPQELEQTYSRYLQANHLPAWAQHYARCVTRDFQAQALAGQGHMTWLLLLVAGRSVASDSQTDDTALVA